MAAKSGRVSFFLDTLYRNTLSCNESFIVTSKMKLLTQSVLYVIDHLIYPRSSVLSPYITIR